MSNGINAELKVPDLWYDFYARILPGSAFVAVVRLTIIKNFLVPDFHEIFIIALAGYFCALLTQPLSSRIAIYIEGYIEKRKSPNKGDRLFVRRVQAKLGRTSRESMILSKMHGEIVFFIQLFVLGIVFLFLNFFFDLRFMIIWNILFIIFVSLGAFEVTSRRAERALDYDLSTT